MREIIIAKSWVENKGDLARLNTEIIEDGVKKIVFAEVEAEYADYLCPELADGILFLCLPIAMRNFDAAAGDDDEYANEDDCVDANVLIKSDVPVSEIFLHNIKEILLPTLEKGDPDTNHIIIDAPISSLQFSGTGVGTGNTGGVDSLYTISNYLNSPYPALNLTHLVITSESNDLWLRHMDPEDDLHSWVQRHKSQFARYERIAKAVNLPFIKIFTNYFNFLCLDEDNARINHLYVFSYLSIASILALKKLWKGYLYSSSAPYSSFTLKSHLTRGSHYTELLLNHVLTIPGFFAYSSGIRADRNEKIMAIADNELAKEFLHPCFSLDDMNCSLPTCNKCLRTLITLDYYDKLEQMQNVFHVDRYKNNKIEYFVTLLRDMHDPHYAGLYDLIKDKFPDELNIAECIAKNNETAKSSIYLLNKIKTLESVVQRLSKNNGSDMLFINKAEAYLDEIIKNINSYIVIVAVKDTAGSMDNAHVFSKLLELGCSVNLANKFRRGYVALIAGGKLAHEDLSKDVETVEYETIIDSLHIKLKSSPYGKENKAEIVINNFDYAINRRGLNIVVVKKTTGQVLDSVAIDAYAKDCPVYRES